RRSDRARPNHPDYAGHNAGHSHPEVARCVDLELRRSARTAEQPERTARSGSSHITQDVGVDGPGKSERRRRIIVSKVGRCPESSRIVVLNLRIATSWSAAANKASS